MPVPKGVDPKKYDDCVADVKKKGKVNNAYAVCAHALENVKTGAHLLPPKAQCEAVTGSSVPQLSRKGVK